MTRHSSSSSTGHPHPTGGHGSNPRFSKDRRPFGDPVSPPKPYSRFEPPPFSNLQNLKLPLRAVVPQTDQRVQNDKKIVFHCVGDTGGIHGTETQRAIAVQMEKQFKGTADNPAPLDPAFFYHLGDVVYFNGQSQLYGEEFYEPYQYYPAPIFAIPGNHDGDTEPRPGDAPVTEPTLTGFIRNFCDSQPQHVSPYRPTMTQPYVYWTLDAPFVTIIGLYSNVDGDLDGRGTVEQERWLTEQLKAADKDKCLLLAVHHAPFSLDSAHGGYPDIIDALERAMQSSGRSPDAIFSGHVHNYQRFTRQRNGRQIPCVIAGAGGYANNERAMHHMQRDSENQVPRPLPFKTTDPSYPGVSLEAFNETDAGFLRLTIDAKQLTCEYFTIPINPLPPAPGKPKPGHHAITGVQPSVAFDAFTLDWKAGTIATQTKDALSVNESAIVPAHPHR